jgi:hypothetical protein
LWPRTYLITPNDPAGSRTPREKFKVGALIHYFHASIDLVWLYGVATGNTRKDFVRPDKLPLSDLAPPLAPLPQQHEFATGRWVPPGPEGGLVASVPSVSADLLPDKTYCCVSEPPSLDERHPLIHLWSRDPKEEDAILAGNGRHGQGRKLVKRTASVMRLRGPVFSIAPIGVRPRRIGRDHAELPPEEGQVEREWRESLRKDSGEKGLFSDFVAWNFRVL